jgi:predicted RNA binding protein YcfA (HicA-like mRNA interferase family)
VGRLAKILDQVLRGGSDQNIAFDDLTALLVSLGFQKRIKGSHHVFSKDGVEEIINVQPSGDKAKPYQVKQVRAVIVKYKLSGE